MALANEWQERRKLPKAGWTCSNVGIQSAPSGCAITLAQETDLSKLRWADTERKLLNFENWINGVKNDSNLSHFFFIEIYQFRIRFFVIDINFKITLSSKMMPNF